MPRTTKKTIAPIEKHTIPTVPAAEQPYPVPENWRWTRIKYLCSLKNGRAFKPTDWSESGLPIVRIQNLNNPDSNYNYYNGDIDADNRLFGGELLFAWSGTPGTSFGAHIWQGKDAILNQHIFRVDFDENILNKLFYMFAINQRLDMLISAAHGGAGLQHVTKGIFEATPIPLPPLAEQQRIVDRIERLFAKLDESREKAQAVVDGFENRKAAILHKAFTGELTRKWREERGIGITNWQKYTIQELCDKITCGKTPKEHITAIGDIPFLKVYNIVNNKIEFESASQFIPETIHKNKLSSSILRPNDVIMNIVGPPLRKVAIIPNRYPEWNMNQAIVRFRPNNKLNYKFLYYFLINPETLDKIIPETRGVVGQVNISVSQSRNLIIMLPKLIEQIEIVKSLDTIFSQEQRARDLAESVIAQIDGMKKAILARAFRGELGTNDPSEAACEG